MTTGRVLKGKNYLKFLSEKINYTKVKNRIKKIKDLPSFSKRFVVITATIVVLSPLLLMVVLTAIPLLVLLIVLTICCPEKQWVDFWSQFEEI